MFRRGERSEGGADTGKVLTSVGGKLTLIHFHGFSVAKVIDFLRDEVVIHCDLRDVGAALMGGLIEVTPIAKS